MAWEMKPSPKWQEILDIQDEQEQGRAATAYVISLEKEILDLKFERDKAIKRAKHDLIGRIMDTRDMKEWLYEHDKKISDYQDWSGFPETR